jgi:nitrate reductase gamma subunit
MDDNLPHSNSNKPEGQKPFSLNPILIVSFVMLALGVGAISFSNFMSEHNPSFFFDTYTYSSIVAYYIIINILNPLGFLLIGISLYVLISTVVRNIAVGVKLPQENLEALRERVKEEPDKIEPIWDLGRANLQQYFNRNLRQISNIYWLSVAVMMVGFLLIMIGIAESFVVNVNSNNTVLTPALIGALAGVITEFIGATFLFIYRSTVQQATNYMKTLERINSVGMATKILDSISDNAQKLRDETKAEIVKLLLSQGMEPKDVAKSSGMKPEK